MSRLGALAEYMAKLKASINAPAARKTGERFMEIAERPDTFTQGRAYAPDRPGLEKQFGVQFGGDIYGEGPGTYSLSAAGGKPATVRRMSAEELRKDAGIPLRAHSLLPYMDDFDSGRNYYSVDTLALDKGTGAGKQLYPALYGDMLNSGNRNVIESLTPENRVRHLQNRSNAVMRDPRAARELMVYPPVLEEFGISAPDFMKLAPEEQLGLMQKMGALNTLRSIDYSGKRAAASSHPQAGAFAETLRNMPENLSSFTPIDEYKAMAQNLRTSRGLGGLDSAKLMYDPLLTGPASLRKAGIVLDDLYGKPVSSRAGKGLEYKEGGALHACTCGR